MPTTTATEDISAFATTPQEFMMWTDIAFHTKLPMYHGLIIKYALAPQKQCQFPLGAFCIICSCHFPHKTSHIPIFMTKIVALLRLHMLHHFAARVLPNAPPLSKTFHAAPNSSPSY